MEQQDKKKDHEVSLLDLLYVLVRGKMLIIKMCSIAILASVVYSLTLPNIYSATAAIIPPQKESGGGLSALLGQTGGLAGLAAGLGGGSDLYLGILKSRSVADAVIQRLSLEKVYEAKSLESVRRRLVQAVRFQAGKDGIITITADDRDAKLTALLANAYVDELARTTVRLNLSKAGSERMFLEKRLSVVKKDLTAAEEDIKSFSQRHKVVQVDAQAKATIEGVARLKAELATKEVQLAMLKSRQTDQSPEVKAVQNGITRLKDELGSLGGSGGSNAIPAIGNVPAVGLEYSRKLRELKTQEAVFEQLMKQYELAKLNEAKDSSSFQVLDEAVIPLTKSKPSRAQIVIISTLSAFFLAALILFVQEYLGKLPEERRKVYEQIKNDAFRVR